jgi:ferredoxin, 2Fe-2S
MHLKRSDNVEAETTVPIKFILEDPQDLTGTDQQEWESHGHVGESILEAALEQGINIEHSCGGVCACSTCHVYIEEGMEVLSSPQEDEEDRVEEAPDVRINSRLSCQCKITGEGPIVVRVPGWNRNAVKEVPH